ncbi:MAG: nucleotidyltransferase [Hydrogenobaculum sp.]|nr:MAG: nucleotidyltransferase [Hydrogenobaculum sp.]PMP92961.1 MAG: nucleotidyltransferase [Hydrogenobaculum sp.]
MKTLEDLEDMLKQNKHYLKDEYFVKQISIFGSYVKGKQRKNSDLDILVEFERPISLIRFIKLEKYLSKLLGIKIDLVVKKSLKPYIKNQVLKEAVPVWQDTSKIT